MNIGFTVYHALWVSALVQIRTVETRSSLEKPQLWNTGKLSLLILFLTLDCVINMSPGISANNLMVVALSINYSWSPLQYDHDSIVSTARYITADSQPDMRNTESFE